MNTQPRKAICCTCGEVRTCRRPRNHQPENWWLIGPVDPNWHRELGDLKCSNCGQVTRHAILHAEGDSFRDHAERITRVALGGDAPHNTDCGDRMRDAYRQGRQSNPYLNHLWSSSDEQEARAVGRTTVITYCGEVERIPEESRTLSGGEQLQPEPVRWEQGYEDPATGAWWMEMDCVDCLQVENQRRRTRQREDLAHLLIQIAVDTKTMPDHRIAAVLAAIKTVGETDV